MSHYDLDKEVIIEIVSIAKAYGIKKLLLFGSRSRGDNHAYSDIDLAVAGGDVLGFSLSVEEKTNTLLSFDVVDLDEQISEVLRSEIDRDGIDLYALGVAEMKKYESFASCLGVLEQADRELAAKNEIYRMGIIGQFNLTFELAWKALKETLELYGVAEAATGSPREIFKAAYKLGWLKDEKIWLDMLKKRNVAIHVYDEERALTVMEMVFSAYIVALQDLREELRRRLTAAE
ncbi:HI0074 family nucleotidyltransferase substrate-binding subunit [Selenomonas ruminantium]|uniref:Nucleotidyltransferase substrate binding protein, HI0074 family n=1 Tax=Selenomonas ruminantium TaxID=971 RepID=A0A1H0UHH0_SELRU|nr:HI0074 family nucleotidyltransferase substrate-binding subunit [Selenomonas ruminantium]SDP65591.1 nucleotidyltransferase substrate binding protein, HI0074 family [Selenomonas ruminantium]